MTFDVTSSWEARGIVQGCRYRVVAGALAGVVLLSGCASAPAGRSASADVAQESHCVQPTSEAAGQPSWVHAVGLGIAGVAIGALWGASEGVTVGFSVGTNSGQAAWIAAAAGAGLRLRTGSEKLPVATEGGSAQGLVRIQ